MRNKLLFAASVAAILGVSVTAQAQQLPVATGSSPWPTMGMSGASLGQPIVNGPPMNGSQPGPTLPPQVLTQPGRPQVIPVQAPQDGLPATVPAHPSQHIGDCNACKDCAPPADNWGPTMPEDLKLFNIPCADCCGVRFYGWLDAGYTYASTGQGILPIEPRENRFGREFLLDQIALVLDKPLKSGCQFDWGFNATFYAGADAALLRPEGGFTTTNPRFGADFRNLYLSAHLPLLTEGGVDVKAGRMGTVIGYESALAPYRPFYSNDYQWFYAEDGAFTGVVATWHANKQLDLLAGITMGANTFFTMRGDSPCYLGQMNYWLTEKKQTLFSVGLYMGNNAILAAPGLAGDFDTTIELRIQHDWNKYLTQIIQSDDGWDSNVPGVGTGEWYSLYNIFVLHTSPCLDLTNRVEWFDDVNGTRTGVAANYGEVTVGLDYHPIPCLRLRPEARYDFADQPAFGSGTHSQFTAAIDMVLSF